MLHALEDLPLVARRQGQGQKRRKGLLLASIIFVKPVMALLDITPAGLRQRTFCFFH